MPVLSIALSTYWSNMPKHKCPEFENHERWVIPYADMITLLFALFVVLYAQGVTDLKKSQKVEKSMRRSFGIPESQYFSKSEGKGGTGIGIFDQFKGNAPIASVIKKYPAEPQKIHIVNRDMIKLKTKMENYLMRIQGKKGAFENRVVQIEPSPKGFMLTMFARNFFPTGGTKLLPAAHQILDQLAEFLKEIKRPIQVEGHSDSMALKGGKYKDNWELAAARALSVVRYLIDKKGFPPTMISATSFGHFKPIHTNTTKEGRSLNRRVDIQIIYDPQDM